ncbi:uracil-xanthine permease [Taurinivorans muris]|uniref:Uracil-xanthine permease n=1 Tax=Taurinivorans muris TaxID=2787751 RepID=A0ABY5Y1E9_9BACT|nr:uracil-xanthine permease [Desulfovibrionaceae bacterium LT0009]
MEGNVYNFRFRDAIIGAQMLLVAFGALVLVPLLTGLNSNVALFTAGVGTLLFQIVTRGQIPIFLASSFAFIAPINYGVQTWGLTATLGGMIAVGLFYMFLSFVIKVRGIGFIINLLPPIVTGSVIAVIGLILAPTGMKMAMGIAGTEQVIPQSTALIVSMSSLTATVLVSILGKGILRLLPIIVGIVVGCIVSALLGILDLSPVANAKWFSFPDFTFPTFELAPILYFVPVALAPAIEHFGDVLAISSVTGKNFLEKPGISRTMFGDGIATSFACLLGGPPNTTYSEVTGAVALTKSVNPAIMTWAAIAAILLSCVGKLGAVLHCVPMPVMGGIMILLFGSILVVGLNTLVQSRENLMETRNLVIVAMVIIFGIGGISIDIGDFHLSGIGLSALIGVLLNLILPGKKQHQMPVMHH